MTKDHFISKMQHLMSRFGYPATTPNKEAADQEQRDWVSELWHHVKKWTGDQQHAFDRSIDSFVAAHKGGRPTVAMVLSKTRQEAGGRPLEFDGKGNPVLDERDTWGEVKDQTTEERLEEREFKQDPEAAGLMGYALRDYIEWRRKGLEPDAALIEAIAARDSRAGNTDGDRVRAQKRLQEFQKKNLQVGGRRIE